MHCHAEPAGARLTSACCCADPAPAAEMSEAVRPSVSVESPALFAARTFAAIDPPPAGSFEIRPIDYGIDRSPPPSFLSPLRI